MRHGTSSLISFSTFCQNVEHVLEIENSILLRHDIMSLLFKGFKVTIDLINIRHYVLVVAQTD